jgi:mannose-6-phosphate isomerase-like protein (cupin superfamily)
MWRRNEFGEETVDVAAGVCVTIPVDTCFQFRSLNDEPLLAIGVTMPPWSGSTDATMVDGPWIATVGAALD